MIVDKEPQEGNERRIIEALRKKELGFNELYRELACDPSRATLKEYLDRLRKQKLVYLKKASKRGKKDLYGLEELAKDLTEQIKRLEAKWIGLNLEMRKLKEVARNPSSSPEEIVNVSNYLIHKGFNLVAGGVVAYRGFSKETRQKILVFSQLKFDEFFDKALGVLKGSPEQEKQFIEVYHKASEGLLLELFSKIVSTNVWSEINPPKGQTALLDGDLQKLAKEMEKVIRDEHKREAST